MPAPTISATARDGLMTRVYRPTPVTTRRMVSGCLPDGTVTGISEGPVLDNPSPAAVRIWKNELATTIFTGVS